MLKSGARYSIISCVDIRASDTGGDDTNTDHVHRSEYKGYNIRLVAVRSVFVQAHVQNKFIEVGGKTRYTTEITVFCGIVK